MSERLASTYRRSTATPAEEKMMILLTNAKIPFEWQEPRIDRTDEPARLIINHEGHPIEMYWKTYRPDFCIMPDRKILIEIDGKIHSKHEDYDLKRDAYLTKRGYKVLRFPNRQVMHKGKDVIQVIQTEIARK